MTNSIAQQQVAPDGRHQATTTTTKSKSAGKSSRVLTAPVSSSPAACQLSSLGPQAPQFDYLVPINICITSQPVAQQPSLKDQPLVESVSWALFSRSSRRVEWSRSVKLESRDSPRASLNDAIQQIDASLAGKNFLLVTCGPAHLRQYLHPIAKRLKVELGPNYNHYTDLLKDFDRCTFKSGTIVGRQVGKSAAPQHHHWQQARNNNSTSPSAPHNATPTAADLGHMGSAWNGSPDNCCCCTGGVADDATLETQVAAVDQYGSHARAADSLQLHCSTATMTRTPTQMSAASRESNGEKISERQAPVDASPELTNYCQELRQLRSEPMQQVSSSGRVGPEPPPPPPSASLPMAAPTQPSAATAATCRQATPNEPLQCQAQAQPQQQLQQQQQQISTGTRKRFEEILKFLSINLDLSRGCSPSGTKCALRKPPPSVHDNNQTETCNSNNDNSSSSNNGGTGATIGGNGDDATKPSSPSTDGSAANCADCRLATGKRLVEAMCSAIERMLDEGHSFNRYERIKRRVEVGLCTVSTSEAEQRVVRARGLPWQASEQDIADFFIGLNIAKGGVGLCLSRQGRRNGEALIQFESREHRNLALSRHKHFMGTRYIEVYRASGEDFLSVAAGYNNKAEAFLSRGAQAIMRMRGLPFTCTARQVVDFFATNTGGAAGAKQKGTTTTCEVFAGEEGVLFVKNHEEKPTGDAFVLFAHEDHLKRALTKHHQNIGTRYVELFRSTVSEVQQVLSISVGPAGSGDQANPIKSTGNSASSGTGSRLPHHPATSSGAAGQQRQSRQAAAATTTAPAQISGRSGQQHIAAAMADSGSAFPALTERPIVWQRPDAATYAQVAHSRQQQQQQQQQRQDTPAVQPASCATKSGSDQKDSDERAKLNDQDCVTEERVACDTSLTAPVQEASKKTKTDKSSKKVDLSSDQSDQQQQQKQRSRDSNKSNLPKLKHKEELAASGDAPSCEPTGESPALNADAAASGSQESLEASSRPGVVGTSQIDVNNLHEQRAASLNRPCSANKTPAPTPSSRAEVAADSDDSGPAASPGGVTTSAGSSVISRSTESRTRSSSLSTRGSSSSSSCELSPRYNNDTHYSPAAPTAEAAGASPMVATAPMAPIPYHHQQQQQQHYMAHPSMYNISHQQHLSPSGRRHYHNNHHYQNGGRPGIASHRYQHQHQYHPMAYQPPPPPHHMHAPLVYSGHQQPAPQAAESMGAPSASAPAAAHYPGQQRPASLVAAPSPQTYASGPAAAHPPAHFYNQFSSHQHQQQYAAAVAAAAAAAADPTLTSQRDCVRLRGLPFEAQIDDVLSFLGKHSENILYQGVHMVYSAQGQATGEAIIQMSSCQAAAATAQDAHRRVMSVGKKQRYIEVIPSSIDDMKPTLGYGLAAFAASRAAATAAAAAYHHHHHHQQQQQHHQHHMQHQPAAAYYSAGQSASGSAEGAPLAADQPAVAMHYGQAGEYGASSEQESREQTPPSPPTSEHHHHQANLAQVEGAANSDDPLDQCACAVQNVETTSIDSGLSGADEHLLHDQDKLDNHRHHHDRQHPVGPDLASPEAASSPSSVSPLASASIATAAGLTPSEQQQQQAIVAATAAAQAAAAAYYPILYYYPPQHQMMSAAGPAQYH